MAHDVPEADDRQRGRARPMHGEMCPTTLQEAKPKAGSSRRPNVRRRGGPQTGVEAQKSKPYASPADRFCRSCYSNRRSVTPTKINRGGSGGTNGTWARTGRNVEATSTTVCSSPPCRSKRGVSTRIAGVNLRRVAEPHERRRTTVKEKGKTCVVRPGCAMPAMGSGTPREEGAIWRMTSCGRRNPGEGARVVRVACERDDMMQHRRPVCRPVDVAAVDRIRRSHLRVRSKTQVPEQ
jgi:hypothetical protein